MQVILLKGAPASGKSVWAKAKVAEDPTKWMRQNNDDLRAQLNGSVFNGEIEKLVSSTRLFIIKEAINKGLNIIIDNINADRKHWEDTIKLAREANKDCIVEEKHFYCPLKELLERNAKREGVARVPDDVVKKFYNKLGGKGFQNSIPRVEEFKKREVALDRFVEPMKFPENAPNAIITDLDGTLAIIGNRSPYDASNCDIVDKPNPVVVSTVQLYYDTNHILIFCSGRMEKDRAPTERFIEKCLGHRDWKLLMRKDGDQRKDAIVKKEILDNEIKDHYNIKLVMDDRISVCRMWFENGLNLFRVGDPDSSF